MLSDVELLAWYKKLGLAESARAVIDHIRSSNPARRVGGGRHNVSGFYPSKKMGVTIQFESHRVELAAVYELEHDDSVLEYFDQPPSFKLQYEGTDGRCATGRSCTWASSREATCSAVVVSSAAALAETSTLCDCCCNES